MIKHCECTHYKGNTKAAEYQNRKYGHGNRVHNKCDKQKPPIYRCTICGKTK